MSVLTATMRKPLNKVAFICFVFSMSALAVTVLGNDETDRTQFNLIYAMALLFAVAVWSGAYLHRSRGLKAIGAIGGIAALLPLAAIVAGHVFVGLGTYLGVDALLEPAHDETALGSLPVNAVEAVFIVWCLATAVLLLRGHIDSVSETTNHEKSRSTDLSNA